MTGKPRTIDEYLPPLSDEKRAALQRLRRAIRSAAHPRSIVLVGSVQLHPTREPSQPHRAEVRCYSTRS